MARKKKDSLSAFDTALDEFGFSNSMSQEEVTNINDVENGVGIDNPDDEDEDHTDVEPNVEDNNGGGNFRDDDSEIPDNILNITNNTSTETNTTLGEQDDTTEISENERLGVGAFFDAFTEALHWDVDEDHKPDSIEGLIDYIGAVVDENSKPQYADQRIQQLDEFVRNGGNFEDFYKDMSQTYSYDGMDMDDESNQKAVVRDYLRVSGYNDDQIQRKLERYEDADMLFYEAEDAVARLKEIHERDLQMQQEQQARIQMENEAKAAEFMNSLTGTINGLTDIRGIAIPKEDRRALYDYITRQDENGLTQYQKDFNKNMVNNLIESAYFTMKGDKLIGSAKATGQTSAANKLRTMLRHSSTNHSRYNVNDDKQRSVVDIASQFYR